MLPGQTQMQPFNPSGGFLPGQTQSNGVQDISEHCERKSCYVNCRLNGLGGGRCTRQASFLRKLSNQILGRPNG